VIAAAPLAMTTILDALFAHPELGICLLDAEGAVVRTSTGWRNRAERSRVSSTVERAQPLENGYTLLTRVEVGFDSSPPPRSEDERAQRALEESDARFLQLVETIEEVFWLTDVAKGEIIYISPGYERIWGRTCESLRLDPRAWLDAIHPEDRGRILEAALTKQVRGTYDEEYRIVRPDGSIRWIRDRAFPVRDASGHVFRVAGSAQDVTARRELEAQLLHTQKMESIGLLAGGIAHDFNNILTVIASSCHALAELHAEENGETAKLISEIETAGERAATLTRQLLAFSRREAVAPRRVNLADVVRDTEKMLRRTIGEDVLLHLTLGVDPLDVVVDPGSFAQLLLNLAINARDAMPRGGELAIAARPIEIDGALSATHPSLRTGPGVLLTVTDTGSGMSPEILARVFEPFFTTKGLGRGTGLGLAVVHGIVTQAGGVVEASSTPGEGTTFRVILPGASTQASSTDPAPRPSTDRGGTETILVVEDEDVIRKIVVRTLEKAGYRVLQASHAQRALEIATELSGPLHLLITDVVMPGMDGHSLAQQLHRTRPATRILYSSGYTPDAVVRYGITDLDVAFLPKPYGPAELRQKVREVLDQPGRDAVVK
jgi:two-component system, cell cycle sensor histidine kinase and response regulator CckA